jgi:ubiquinone/menaquinone biosynthesis C-methylase UbiE
MRFEARPDSYDRFMGRYAAPLAKVFAKAAGVGEGMRVLDVGCGPGALTAELIAQGAQVAAIDPAEQFAQACAERNPTADVRVGPAEELPFADASFDAAMAQLVIAFMSDPDAGVREMARVTRPGGTVAACMWDLTGDGMAMLALFWRAIRAVDPSAAGEARRPGTFEGDIAERLERAGLRDIHSDTLVARSDYTGFDDLWEPMTMGVGPAGMHLRAMGDDRRDQVREALRELVPDGPFSLEGRAWFARGTVA